MRWYPLFGIEVAEKDNRHRNNFIYERRMGYWQSAETGRRLVDRLIAKFRANCQER